MFDALKFMQMKDRSVFLKLIFVRVDKLIKMIC